MKGFYSLLAVLVLISSCLCVSVSAADVSEVASKTYPTWDEYQLMLKQYPDDITYKNTTHIFDSHIIGFDGNNNVVLFTYDSSIADVSCNLTYVSTSKLYINSSYLFVYSWDDKTNSWVDPYASNGGLLGYVSVSSDFLIYTDTDIRSAGSENNVYAQDTLIGVKSPSWLTLTWENTFKDLPKNLSSEIVGLLPIIITFLVFLFGIYKGIRFLFSFLSSS